MVACVKVTHEDFMKSHCVKDVRSWADLVGDEYPTIVSIVNINYGCIYEYFYGEDWMLFYGIIIT